MLLPKVGSGSGDVDLEPWCSPVSDQLHLSSCVANAVADSYELLDGIRIAREEADARDAGDPLAEGLTLAEVGRWPEQISRLQIYFNGRSRMRKDGQERLVDDGMYFRSAFDAVRILGVCPESMWPYVPENVNRLPSVESIWYSLKHKIDSYYRVYGTGREVLDDSLLALRSGHPVVFSVPVTEVFSEFVGAGPIPAPRPGDAVLGYHAIMLVGSPGGEPKIRNSWGPGWGSGGYAVLHPDWFIQGHVASPYVPTMGVRFR